MENTDNKSHFFRLIAVTSVIFFLNQCTFLQQTQQSLYESFQSVPEKQKGPLPSDRIPIRILPMVFKNSANMTSVSFVSDQVYEDCLPSPDTNPLNDNESLVSETELNSEEVSDDSNDVVSVPVVNTEPADSFDGGLILKEIISTQLIQSDRFEFIDPKLTGLETINELPSSDYIEKHKVDYLLYADLTNFEVDKTDQYWKIPLWSLLLIAAIVVNDDDFRNFVLEGLLRLWLYLPSDSPFWELGAGIENMELSIKLGIDLRLVNPQTGSVVYVKEQQIDRIEEVGNLDLIVWGTSNSLSIKESSAGKQIRFLSSEIIEAMEAKVDNGSLPSRF